MQIERRILSTPEAAQVVLPSSSVEQSLGEIRQRYLTDEEFVADLNVSGLDPVSLADAIRRDLTVDAVLDRIASRVAEVTETDVEIFYLMHRERFKRPEFRRFKHILVTINENMAGSDRQSAREKIDAIRERLLKSPGRFAEQALKHSECPTATNGGELGTVKRGQLFPELEPAAFALDVEALSEVLESPIGFHLMCCEAIEEARELPLPDVRAKIRQQLSETRRRSVQKTWVARLFKQEG